ncbi:MAG: hypothetical protein JWP91_3536 [Fibrobacteres bacterium]|nr:hypothetical protein [Fibrobacterota bacterium]
MIIRVEENPLNHLDFATIFLSLKKEEPNWITKKP